MCAEESHAARHPAAEDGHRVMSEPALTEPYPGVSLRTTRTPQATINQYEFQQGAAFPLHHHPQAQITIVLEGSLLMETAGVEEVLPAGSWTYTHGDIEHGISTPDSTARFLAIIVPPRGPGDQPIIDTDNDQQGAHP